MLCISSLSDEQALPFVLSFSSCNVLLTVVVQQLFTLMEVCAQCRENAQAKKNREPKEYNRIESHPSRMHVCAVVDDKYNRFTGNSLLDMKGLALSA